MTLKHHDVEYVALDLIERFGDLAEPIARELAVVSHETQDDMLLSTEAWRDVIDAIKRLHLTH